MSAFKAIVKNNTVNSITIKLIQVQITRCKNVCNDQLHTCCILLDEQKQTEIEP